MNERMKNILFFLLAASLLATGVSCKKSFLDREPQTSIAPSQFFNTEQDLSLYINGLLTIPGTESYVSDQSSDNLATTGAIELKTVIEGVPTAQNITGGWNSGTWSRLRDINYFLDNYSKAAVDSAIKGHYAGLARFYRAMFYFGMVQRYSDVPWYSHALSSATDSNLYKARDPRALVMDSVMADLDFAAGHVRMRTVIPPLPTGTPDVWVVKQFYSRVALYEGTYRRYHPELGLVGTDTTFLKKARDVSSDIITNGGFGIYSTGNPTSDYATLFSSQDLTGNTEVLLPNIYDVTLKRDGTENTYLFGNYEQSPSRDLVKTYLMSDGSRLTDKPGYQQYGFVDEFTGRDPRLMQTLAYPGWIKLPDTKPYVQVMSTNFTGYHQLKGYINSTDANVIGGADFPGYRYAEVLLIYAEAQAELGALAQSDLDKSVNLLRSRVGMPPMNMAAANGNPDPVLQAAYPKVSGGMAGVLLEIRRERRVELALEGFRYDDLMRWDAASLLLKAPQGMYFPGLGQFDLTGDGVADIVLIDKSTPIPSTPPNNSLGVPLVYYQAGTINDGVTVALQNGSAGGPIITEAATRKFIDPQYYYRPVPATEILLNPALKQIFGW
jgi:starch-binding outer membrane protein, SusD/RagB family